MSRVLLQFSCAPGDAEAIVAALRAACDAPIHVAPERVHGRDFSDARTGEQVDGALDRRAISVAADAAELERLVALARGARRRQPLRWQALPLVAEGREEP